MSQPMFCVCLVLNLLFIAANGQRRCTSPLFGENCTLQCHCNQTDICSSLGDCPLDRCKTGYFGPGCQYVNLAEPSSANPSFLTDNDEESCNPDKQTTTLSFELPVEARFFWLRLIRRRSATARDVEVRINGQLNSCPNHRVLNHTIPRALDIMCDVRVLVKSITIIGGVVPWICSLEYGAGRNVALFQHAEQSSPFAAAASLAVDGDTGTTYCTRINPQLRGAYWSVTFSHPYLLYNVRIFFKYDANQPGVKFTLKTFGEGMAAAEEYRDYKLNPRVDLPMYSIFPVKHLRVEGMANAQPSQGLTLCEVQAFGVQVCPEGFYGYFCRNICSCDPYQFCDPITGGCGKGCPDGFYGFECATQCPKNCLTGRCDIRSGKCERCVAGFTGDSCHIPCLHGTYGLNCAKFCPIICGEHRCDPVVGSCLKCNGDFVPPKCEVCISGRYGQDCSQSCPQNCAENVCSNTGICFRCKEQFIGDRCEDIVPVAAPPQVPWLFIIAGILIFLLLIVLLIVFLLKRWRQPQPVEERKPPAVAAIRFEDYIFDKDEFSSTITKDSDSEGSTMV